MSPHRCQNVYLHLEVSKGSCKIHTCTTMLSRGFLRMEKPSMPHTQPISIYLFFFANTNNFLKIKITNASPNLEKRVLSLGCTECFPCSLHPPHAKWPNLCKMNQMPLTNFLFLTSTPSVKLLSHDLDMLL